MTQQRRSRRRLTRTLTITTSALAAVALLTACSAGSAGTSDEFGFASVEQDPAAPLTIWVDAAREPIAKAFQADNPDLTVNIETYDGSAGGSDSFKTKVALFDQSGEGWPDAVFSTQQNDTAWASVGQNGAEPFAAVLNEGLMSDEFLDGFTPGALDPMTVDGKVYGVRNDLAPVVYWYNEPLMSEFGYEIPTTWEEYQELSDKVAAEHPGYILGSVGDSFAGPYTYYWSGEAPIFQVEGDTFSSDFDDENSKKVTELIDHMLANGTLVQDSVFGADFVSTYGDKLLGTPGPAWFAGAIFQNPDSVNAPAGAIGASAPLHWEGQNEVTGNVGGGVWYGSSHSKNLDGVAKFLEYVSSSDTAAELATGLPAYASTADTWLATQEASGYFAGEFQSAITKAAGSVWSGWGFPSFSPETAYSSVVIPGLAAGKTLSELVPDLQAEYENSAQVQGYTVK
ncbi:ABC transporter substrate-binding protein [Agromyces atrinae]|uniref:Extracellular solute-binding protein n=1 Tax=Agromyces atrinae TaxID=592376 RepID=A0A4Q2M1A0_9MICO|nr:extracellular solute-binding protein [Agromyces atrinae]NYD68274.1 multiple sugar transport system substrate-binding protein [Agromyces atrinae]RXZ85665.1 extracellular solute-binding protein [Agromyces atrinae]